MNLVYMIQHLYLIKIKILSLKLSFTIDDLIQDFDKYSTFFYKDKIQKHDWDISDGLDIKLYNEKVKL